MIQDRPDTVLEDIDLTKNAYIIYESRVLATRSATAQSSKTYYTPGLCGLSNLGNTCFMNSALQCVSNVPELTEYFLHDEYISHINRDNPLGMKGDVAKAYGELVHEMWSGKTNYCAPKSLKHSVSRYAPQFSGYQQQDSQEFMSFLLDGLHEDLNLVRQKPYIDKKDDDGKADDVTLAAEQWDYYRKRNQSKIHDIFHGQIKSVVTCLTCKTTARTFDPICFLSLPLPGKKKIRTFKIDYVRTNGQIKTYYIKSNEHGRMNNLVQEFCNRFQPKEKKEPMDIDGASASNDSNPDEEEEEEEEDFTKAEDYDGHQPKPDFILSAEVYNHRIHLQYGDNALLTSIMDRDQIVFYQTEDSLKKGNSENILMPCVFRDENTRQNFGYPIYLTVPRNNCTGKDIQDSLQVKTMIPTISDILHSFIFLIYRKQSVIFYHYLQLIHQTNHLILLHLYLIKVTINQLNH
jgi:ubiquitin carboxyl-terminal hydrolase 4/11/15